MFARHVTLGRVVIVVAGLLVLLALTSQIWAAGASGPHWAVLAGAVLVIAAVLMAGRTLGGWIAVRRGTDIGRGRKYGMIAVALVLWVALNVYDRLPGG